MSDASSNYKLSVSFDVSNYRYHYIHRARDTDYLSYPKHTIVEAILKPITVLIVKSTVSM